MWFQLTFLTMLYCVVRDVAEMHGGLGAASHLVRRHAGNAGGAAPALLPVERYEQLTSTTAALVAPGASTQPCELAAQREGTPLARVQTAMRRVWQSCASLYRRNTHNSGGNAATEAICTASAAHASCTIPAPPPASPSSRTQLVEPERRASSSKVLRRLAVMWTYSQNAYAGVRLESRLLRAGQWLRHVRARANLRAPTSRLNRAVTHPDAQLRLRENATTGSSARLSNARQRNEPLAAAVVDVNPPRREPYARAVHVLAGLVPPEPHAVVLFGAIVCAVAALGLEKSRMRPEHGGNRAAPRAASSVSAEIMESGGASENLHAEPTPRNAGAGASLVQFAKHQYEKLGWARELCAGTGTARAPVRVGQSRRVRPGVVRRAAAVEAGPAAAAASSETPAAKRLAEARARRTARQNAKNERAPNVHALASSYTDADASTADADADADATGHAKPARAGEIERAAVGRGVVDVVSRYAQHAELNELCPEPALPEGMLLEYKVSAAYFYRIHILDTQRRAMAAGYEKCARDLVAMHGAAMRHFKRTGFTSKEFASLQETPGAWKCADDDIRTAFVLFRDFEELADNARRFIVHGQEELRQEARVWPHVDAISHVVRQLLQSPKFGQNVYTCSILRILVADLFTSVTTHKQVMDGLLKFCRAMRVVLARMRELPALGQEPGCLTART